MKGFWDREENSCRAKLSTPHFHPSWSITTLGMFWFAPWALAHGSAVPFWPEGRWAVVTPDFVPVKL